MALNRMGFFTWPSLHRRACETERFQHPSMLGRAQASEELTKVVTPSPPSSTITHQKASQVRALLQLWVYFYRVQEFYFLFQKFYCNTH